MAIIFCKNAKPPVTRHPLRCDALFIGVLEVRGKKAPVTPSVTLEHLVLTTDYGQQTLLLWQR